MSHSEGFKTKVMVFVVSFNALSKQLCNTTRAATPLVSFAAS